MLSRFRSLKYQLGQSAVEYGIVSSALFLAIYMTNTGCEGYDNCIQKLQVAMHDNYDGYSASLSAVHQYGELAADVSESEWGDGDDGDDGGNSSSGGGGDVSIEEGIYDVTSLNSADGSVSNLTLSADGITVLDENGNEVGTYDGNTSTFTDLDGNETVVITTDATVDEDGNLVYLRAVVDCSGSPPTVYGFVYPHSSGDYYSNVTREKLDFNSSSYCYEPAFEVIAADGSAVGGSIVNGYYYAGAFTSDSLNSDGIDISGEVIYVTGGSGDESFASCNVMVNDWDQDIDMGQSDEEIYAQQLELLYDPDYNVGYLDLEDYAAQVSGGAASWPNNCVSSRGISEP